MRWVSGQVLVAPLQDGNVLAAGGSDADGNLHASAEVYDVTTHLWATVGSMAAARKYHQVRG